MVQLAKLDSWFGGEFVGQHPVSMLVGRERLGLTAIAIQRKHQQRVEALPKRISGDMLAQFADHLSLAAQMNRGVDSDFLRVQPHLGQAGLWVPKTYATWADAVRSAGGFRLVYVRRLEGRATGGMIFGLWA